MTTNPALDLALRQLKLPACAQHYARIAEEAAAANLSYDRYLQALVEQELAHRDHVRQRRYLQQAGFPVVKELSDFDWNAIPSLNRARILTLAQGHYLERAETVLFVGHPGLGKTHLATALGVTATRQGHRVRFATAAGLTAELIQAQSEQRLTKVLAQFLNYRLLILDELGFLPLSQTGAHLLFQFCSTIHERVSLIVTTNLRFADWTQLFGSESLTAALLDRLTARAHILEFVGQSYRLRQRQHQMERRIESAPDDFGAPPQAPTD